MSVIPFKAPVSLAVSEGWGPDTMRFGKWLASAVLLWMGRTPTDLKNECLNYLSHDEIDDIESRRHLQRRKAANG